MKKSTALAGLVGLVALTIAPLTGAVGAGVACADEGEMGVAVVVDHADLEGAPDLPVSVCVSVPIGATGAEVLAARAELLRTAAPRYDTSGLLCAIDGVPATGCGNPTPDGGFEYWGYFRGTADDGWSYAQEGPGTAVAEASTVEGWRFTDGSGEPTDPQPSADPDPAVICSGTGSEAALDEPGSPTSTAQDSDDATSAGSGVGVGVGLIAVLGAAGLVIARRRGRARSPR